MTRAIRTSASPPASVLLNTSSEAFNEMVTLRAEYQEHLNAWSAYEDEAVFTRDARQPLPQSDEFFDWTEETYNAVCKRMTSSLASLKKQEHDIRDVELRQSAFTEALAAVLEDAFVGGSNQRRVEWDAFCAFEELVYHREQSWAVLQGSGRDIDSAWRLTNGG